MQVIACKGYEEGGKSKETKKMKALVYKIRGFAGYYPVVGATT